MADRPTAVRLTTVVFVDVEGSTALLRRIGDEEGLGLVRRQLVVVRERIEPYGGSEVKSLGDGWLVTFAIPRQAVSFALASQRALADSTPRVRFGIHTGEVIDSDADVHGAVVNAAARIAARAAGGEVLVSDVVRQLVGPAPTMRFGDRGRCRLKGFDERWHLWAADDSSGDQPAPPTIGRRAELVALAEVVSSTAAGVGRVLLVEGEPGIGKTHLLLEATAQARRTGVGVVAVTADELVRRPGVVPHGLVNATRPGLESRERLEALLNGPVTPIEDREDLSYVVIEASADLLEDLARAQPVLVVVEDLHWADDLSLAVLAELVRRAVVSRFSVIGSLRPSPRPPALDRLVERIGHGLGIHLRLGSLDEIDVHALATAITGASPSHALRERLRGTAGNPLYVAELLRSFEDDGLLRVEDGIADVTPGLTSMSLNETLVRRLSWLPGETNDLLRLASLLGSGFTLGDLATITGRPVIDVAAWLREASLAGLIVGDGDRLTFRHDLIREAVYLHMLPAERRDLHRAAGKALANVGAPTQQVAEQYARGARPDDVDAVRWLERAAIETISVSPSNAVALLDQALKLAPSHWPARAALQARMIEPLTWCGRFDDAEAMATTILAAAPAADVEYDSLRGLAAAQGNRGQTAAAIATLQRAAAAPGAPADEARQLRCLAAQLSMMTAATSVDSTQLFAEETLTLAVDDGDATTQCLAHQVLGIAAAFTGHSVLGRDHLSAALALLDSGQVTAASYLIPETFQAMGLLELDAIDSAIVVADNGRKRAERTGALAFLPLTYLAAASAQLYAGRWDDACAEIEAGLAVVGHTGSYLSALYYEAILAKVALHRGDLATARAHLDVGTRRFAEGVGFFGVDWLFGAMAESLAANGKLEKALTAAETIWVQTAPARYVYGHRPRGVLLVRLAARLGRAELARAVTADLEEGARRSPAVSAAGAALQCRSLVEGDPDLALEAVARYRQTPLRPDLAACCEDAAGILAAADRRDEAVELLREAVVIYAHLEASGDTTRVERALRGLGARLPRRRPARPSFGWDALTPTELAVSRLVAQGLTNPEIGARLYISRRTVETHLSHVFTKVGLTSRTHLAAEFTRRGSGP